MNRDSPERSACRPLPSDASPSFKGSLLESVEQGLPSLLRARRITELAATVGFDWPDIAPVWDKISEEIKELQDAVAEGESQERVESELGDLLLAVTNLSRFLGVDPERALCGATDKFVRRFRGMELALAADGRRMADETLDALEELWIAEKRGES